MGHGLALVSRNPKDSPSLELVVEPTRIQAGKHPSRHDQTEDLTSQNEIRQDDPNLWLTCDSVGAIEFGEFLPGRRFIRLMMC